RWNGKCFDKESLQNLGYRYQLGHSGAPCPSPHPGPKNFIVFDITGPHFVTIDYCHCCDEPLSTWNQLLREKWFPATLTRPQTTFTFDCLETFHELTLQGKTNLYDYYHTLLRRSDNANLSNPIYRYPEFHRVFRMWRNLMALKRGGRGHDPGGIDATANGELMVECPACPHPTRNLPEGWEKAGPLLFLYALYIAVDGNFKLKGKQRYLKDVELMPGWGAYVPEEEYQSHISEHVDEVEINTCESQHDALVRAGTNPLAPSVREMGPAARHDTLNDHWGGWNFCKIVGFRTLFLRRFNDAYKMSAKHTDVFNQLSATFPPATVKKWESKITAWEANPKARNPYAEPEGATTLQDVRLALAKEEAAQVALGNLPRHKMSLSAFLIAGFELEDAQYLIRRQVSQTKGLKTSKQLADLQDKRNALLRLLQNWREAQLVYTPQVVSLLSRVQPPDTTSSTTSSSLLPETLPENIPLFLPSSLPAHMRALPELKEVCQLERRLREPQADDALAEGLWLFNRLNISGTGNRPNTRMITLYKRFSNKTDRAAERYKSAWRSLSALDPGGSWSTRFRELKKEHISGPGRDPEDASTMNS
ncbi:hypothetical protein K443DRAFT_126586, partial [Laccaria amethystina LaAM-08-1]